MARFSRLGSFSERHINRNGLRNHLDSSRTPGFHEPARRFRTPNLELNDSSYPLLEIENMNLPSPLEGKKDIIPKLETKWVDCDPKSNTQTSCSICLNKIKPKDGKVEIPDIKCSHKFHFICLDHWVKNNKRTCPNCRVDLFKGGENGKMENIMEIDVEESP